jgi:hypothetical protein
LERIVSIVALAGVLLIAGCDPGMTIRQRPLAQLYGVRPEIIVHVETTHPLIGEYWYSPQVEVSNLSLSSVIITYVELATKGQVYENKPRRSGLYPFSVGAGNKKSLPVWFDLSGSVKSIFSETVELRVHYRSGDEDRIFSANLEGAPLDIQ